MVFNVKTHRFRREIFLDLLKLLYSSFERMAPSSALFAAFFALAFSSRSVFVPPRSLFLARFACLFASFWGAGRLRFRFPKVEAEAPRSGGAGKVLRVPPSPKGSGSSLDPVRETGEGGEAAPFFTGPSSPSESVREEREPRAQEDSVREERVERDELLIHLLSCLDIASLMDSFGSNFDGIVIPFYRRHR